MNSKGKVISLVFDRAIWCYILMIETTLSSVNVIYLVNYREQYYTKLICV